MVAGLVAMGILSDEARDVGRSLGTHVAVDDEEAVVKKVLYNDNTVELHSVNPYYPPRVFKNNDVTRVQILGLVKEVSKALQ